LNRGESLRALATTGTPIVLGYDMAVALGFYLFVGNMLPIKKLRWLGGLALAAGLIAPLSRGPWVGVAIGYFVFLAVGPKPVVQMFRTALPVLIASLFVLATPYGEKIIDLLPFVGKVDNDNVIYRERLLTNASIVIARNPFFGSFDYYATQEMEELRSGGDDGIIDLVNTYLAVALRFGLVGLCLFVGFFVTLAMGVFKAAKKNHEINNELSLLGRVLLSVLLGVLLIIYTVSSITHVPIIYWMLAGLCFSYLRLSAQLRNKLIKL
jgi:O-antigen ligase